KANHNPAMISVRYSNLKERWGDYMLRSGKMILILFIMMVATSLTAAHAESTDSKENSEVNPGSDESATAQDQESRKNLAVGDVNVVPLEVNGDPDERLNLVIFGDGYTAEEMDTFHEDVDRNLNVMWASEPFRSYRNYFNLYMVETPSKDSGISCDPDDENIRRNTVFNLQYANECPAGE